MPVAQRMYSSWKYNWKYNKQRIWRDVIFPCLLMVILALWFTIIVWFLLDRVPSEKFKDFKYGGFPLTVLVTVWAGVKSVMSVVKPVSSQMVDYLCLPDHSVKLGYQQKVIEDISFLKDEALSYRPGMLWRAFALLWCLITFSWDERYVHSETRMPKMTPASKLRMVVFVDDLDRCQESVILQILSAINLVLAVCNIDVIVGMDKSMIERAVRRMFGDKNNNPSKSSQDLADKYLKKIIQLPLDLPDPSHFESRKFLLGHLGMLHTLREVTETHTDPAPKEKEKMHPKFRIGRENPSRAQEETRGSGGGEINRSSDTAGEADSHLSDIKEQPEIIEESSLQGEERHSVIYQPRADHTEDSSNLGEKQDTAGGADSHLSDKKERTDTIGESSLQEEEPQIVIDQPGADHTENEEQGEEVPIPKEEPTPDNNIPIEMILSRYMEGEGKAFRDLQTEATGSRKLPREWKRLLNYHRLARNILSDTSSSSDRPDVTKLDGWRVQLITWIFVCWEWKDQINTLIQKWHKLDVLTNWGEAESIGPSLREIVEEYIDGIWKGDSDGDGVKGDSAMPGRTKKSCIDIHENSPLENATTISMSKELDTNYIKGVVRDVLKEEREQEQEHSLKLKEVEGSEKEELEDRLKTVIRKVVQEEKGLENWIKELIRKVLAEQEGHQNFGEKECNKGKRIVVSENTTEENSPKQKKENKEKTSHIQKGKGKIKVEEAEQEEEKEREEWIRLRKTLRKYNVSMYGIQAFQEFRFYCVAGYLPWPLPKE